MTLPSSGPISIAQIAAEYLVSLPCVFPTAFHGKPMLPASGPLTIPTDFYGKSNIVFTPDGGLVQNFGVNFASVVLQCNFAAVWTYTGGGFGSSVSLASGASGTQITFSVSAPAGATRNGNWTVTGVFGGITRNFTVDVEASNG